MTLTVETAAMSAPSVRELWVLLGSTFNAVVAARGDLLSVKDLAGGRYLHVNAAMADFLGRGASQIIGCTDAEIFDAPAATALRAADQTAMAQAEPLLSEHRIEWRGARREFEVLRTVVASENNGPRWLCSVWSDLTERL